MIAPWYALFAGPLALWFAYVANVLWGWFLVPIGAPAIGIAHTYGLALILAYATKSVPFQKEDVDVEGLVFSVIIGILKPLLFLGAGWIAHTLMA